MRTLNERVEDVVIGFLSLNACRLHFLRYLIEHKIDLRSQNFLSLSDTLAFILYGHFCYRLCFELAFLFC